MSYPLDDETILAVPAGLEPATFALTGRRSTNWAKRPNKNPLIFYETSGLTHRISRVELLVYLIAPPLLISYLFASQSSQMLICLSCSHIKICEKNCLRVIVISFLVSSSCDEYITARRLCIFTLWFKNGCGGGIRTHDLQLMRLAS